MAKSVNVTYKTSDVYRIYCLDEMKQSHAWPLINLAENLYVLQTINTNNYNTCGIFGVNLNTLL